MPGAAGFLACSLLQPGVVHEVRGMRCHNGYGIGVPWLRRWTALHLALRNGHTEMAEALVAAGADVHCIDSDGYGPRPSLPGLGGGASLLW